MTPEFIYILRLVLAAVFSCGGMLLIIIGGYLYTGTGGDTSYRSEGIVALGIGLIFIIGACCVSPA